MTANLVKITLDGYAPDEYHGDRVADMLAELFSEGWDFRRAGILAGGNGMRGRWLALVLLVGVLACESHPPMDTGNVEDVLAHLDYIGPDPRTGLCFAVVGSTTYYGYITRSITTVPCDAVSRARSRP